MPELNDEQKRARAEQWRNERERSRRAQQEAASSTSNQARTPYTVEEPDDALIPYVYVSQSKKDIDWQSIVKDFKEAFPDQPQPTDNHILYFPSKEAVITFLTAQAEKTPPRKFLFQELEPGTLKPKDVFYLSCGNNKLYMGSATKIQSQLTEELANNPGDPALQEGLNDINHIIAHQNIEDLDENEDDQEESSSNSPGSPGSSR